VIVRSDLTLEQQIVQAVHAAYEGRQGYPKEAMTDPLSVVICTVPNIESLADWHVRLSLSDIWTYVFQEPDLVNQATALCTRPIYKHERKHFKKLSLWRPP